MYSMKFYKNKEMIRKISKGDNISNEFKIQIYQSPNDMSFIFSYDEKDHEYVKKDEIEQLCYLKINDNEINDYLDNIQKENYAKKYLIFKINESGALSLYLEVKKNKNEQDIKKLKFEDKGIFSKKNHDNIVEHYIKFEKEFMQ